MAGTLTCPKCGTSQVDVLVTRCRYCRFPLGGVAVVKHAVNLDSLLLEDGVDRLGQETGELLVKE